MLQCRQGALPGPAARRQTACNVQQQLHSQARIRLTAGSRQYLAGGNGLQLAVERAATAAATAAAGRRCHSAARCVAGPNLGLGRFVSLHPWIPRPPRGAHPAPWIAHSSVACWTCSAIGRPTLNHHPPDLPTYLPAGPPWLRAGRRRACAASSGCTSVRARPTWRSTRACSCCSTAARTRVRAGSTRLGWVGGGRLWNACPPCPTVVIPRSPRVRGCTTHQCRALTHPPPLQRAW